MKANLTMIVVGLACLVVGIGCLVYLAKRDIVATPVIDQTAQIQAYRKAMRDGAGVSAVVNGRLVCKALKGTDAECEQYQKLMNGVGSDTIDKLSDEFILKLMQSGEKNPAPLPTPTPKGEISA